MKLYGMELTKEQLLERVSSMKQLGGIRLVRMEDGKASGVKVAEFVAGDGLSFDVILDRGMDIGAAYYKGMPISWQSKVGMVAPQYFENQGHAWLRDFFGGLLTTCGLVQVGEPCNFHGTFHGLHGRISHIPAEEVSVEEGWEGDEYVMKLRGKMREAIIYGENLTLTREIKCIYGEKKIHIKDIVENEAYEENLFHMMYHVNVPFPIVGKEEHFYTSADSVDLQVTHDQPGAGHYENASEPIPGFQYETFSHNQPMDKDRVFNAVVNERLNAGVYLTYDPKVLPVGNQWKMLGQQDYVVAMEPANVLTIGIEEAEKRGLLQKIPARSKKVVDLEIGILDGREEIDAFLNQWK